MGTNPQPEPLAWPHEGATVPRDGTARFAHAGSNLCLDFHGDPARARLVVFSDGNHHMALAEALARFRVGHPMVEDVFYATTPPRVVVEALKSGSLLIGNLALSCRPHVFISPAPVLEALRRDGLVARHDAFMRNRGCALLVPRDNPKRIRGVRDLTRADVRLFLSNPVTEKVSHDVYVRTLRVLCEREGVDVSFLAQPETAGGRIVYGRLIHHREAPQSLADGAADVAIVFHHLALRYQRIFPRHFERIDLPQVEGATDATHVGLVGDGGPWGPALHAFLLGAEVAAIYRHHGLDPAA